MKSFALKLKTIGIGMLFFILSYLLFEFLFMIPAIHGLYETLETFIYYQIFASTTQPSEHLIIIDEGDAIYDRNTYAKLIAELDRLGAKAITLDVLFPDKRDSVQDAALIKATEQASDKIIHAVEFIDHEKLETIPERFQFRTLQKPLPDHFTQNIYGAVLPFAELLKATRHLGAVAASTDLAYRSEQYFPMLLFYNDKIYPSMPLLAAMKFLNYPTDSLPPIIEDEIVLKTDEESYRIPLDAKSQTLINFISLKKFAGKYMKMEKAFEYFDENNAIFQNKIIIIGNSFDSQDYVHGPHFQSYANLFVYASLISQILNNQCIREAILESLFCSFVLVILGIIWTLFFSNKYTRIKNWIIYIFSFIMLLALAIISIRLSVKLYVILPYAMFFITYALTNLYYEKKLPAIGHLKERLIPLDYYISINPKPEKADAYPVTLISSPAGEDFCELKFSLKTRTINKIREEMAQNFSLDIKTMKEFGADLFKSLFQSRIRDQYDKSMGMAYSQNTNLRIKLRIDAPDLACYPWEFMYDGDQTKEFLALHKNISITRFVSIQNPVPKITTKPPLRILIIISNPNPTQYKQLDVEKEKRIIKRSLKKLEKQGLIQLQFLKKATLNNLDKALRRKVDIIHFIGHGSYEESLGGGCLVFEEENGGYNLVNIDRLSLLLERTPLRLVVLNACQTARITESDISLGVAHGLVKIGVPAVIAMQFSIPDSSAIEFSRVFYTTLAETFQVDRAVSEARRQIFINLETGRIDWGIPVLFMRKDDGIIF
jgi:hypothetical protein